MRVDEGSYWVLRRAEDMLGTNYEINITNDDECKGFIDEDNVTDMIDDLCSEIDRLKEELDDQKEYYENKITDLEQDIEENYKPISPYEFYGVSEHDFY